MQIFKLFVTLKIILAGNFNHPHDPYCPTCAMNDTALAHGYGANNEVHPELHRGDEGFGKIVYTSDALHHGNGILKSVSANQDVLRGKPSERVLEDIMKDTQNAAAKAEIEAKIKEKELKKLEKEIADKKAHQLRHEQEILENEKKRLENIKMKSPEILAKKTTPVITFPSHDFPYVHHLRVLTQGIQHVRELNKKQIEDQQEIAKLDDITDKMAAMNPHTKDPKYYKNILSMVGGDNALLYIPVSPSNGDFFISNTSQTGMNHQTHPLNASFHANVEGSRLPPHGARDHLPGSPERYINAARLHIPQLVNN